MPGPRNLIACLVVAAVVTLTAASHALADTQPSGIDGAGFINTLAIAPDGSGRVAAGGDVSGFHYNTNFAAGQWQVRNGGMLKDEELHVAGITWAPGQANLLYAGTGWRGGGGGFYRSTDGGLTWSKRSNVPQFSGGNNAAPLPTPHPRSVGQVIAVHPTSGTVYAATYNDGVMRSTNGGDTWTTIGLGGGGNFARSILIDPSGNTTVYVATYETTGGSIWRIDNASTSPSTPIRLASSPNKVEDMALIGNRLYAAGSEGLDRTSLPVASGTAWTAMAGAGSQLYSVAGFDAGANDVLYTGCIDAPDSDGNNFFECIKKSTDSGATWQNVTNSTAAINTTVAGTSHQWWFSTIPQGIGNLLGKNGYTTSHIVIDPINHDRIVMAGRSGVWRSIDGGAHWQPAVNGMGGTMNRSVAIDPNDSQRLQVSNTDWIHFESSDRLVNVDETKVGGRSMGNAVAFDSGTSPSTMYEAVSERDADKPPNGEVFYKSGSTWVSTNLGAQTGDARPYGLAVGRDGANKTFVLAVVEGGGLWRRVNGAWSEVSTTIGTNMPLIANMAETPIQAVPGTPFVYVFDRSTGVWRSDDYGVSWTKIWNVTSRTDFSGDLAADPTRPGQVYVQAGTSVYLLTGATTGTVEAGTITKTDITSRVGGYGPLTVAPNGTAWVTTRATNTSTPISLMMSTNGGATWSDKSDAAWQGAAGFAYDIVATSDNYVYAGCTTGVQRFHLTSGGDTVPPATPTGLAVTAQDSALSSTWNANAEPDFASYVVRWRPTGSTAWSTATTVARPYIVTGLTNGTGYDVQVAARDSSGNTSSYSATATGSPRDMTAPRVPSGVTVTAGDASLAASWTANSEPDLASYTVRWKTSASSTWTSANTTAPSRTIASLTNGTLYNVQVAARDATGNISAYSASVNGTPGDTTPPAVPTGLALTAGDALLDASWDTNTEPDLAAYVVQWRSSGSASWQSRSATTTSVSLTGLTNGTTYDVRVAARDGAGNTSAYTAIITGTPVDRTAPAMPTGLTVIAGDARLTASWTANTEPDLASYAVRWRATGQPTWTNAFVTASTRVVTGLTNGISYDVQVAARDTAGNQSAFTATTTGTPIDLTAPAVPTGIVLTPGNTSLTANWTDNTESDVARYVVQWRPTGGSWPTSILGQSTTSTFSISMLTNGTSYDVRLAAVDSASNQSAWSAPVSATPVAAPVDTTAPAVPTGLTVTPGDARLTAAWTANSDPDIAVYVLQWRATGDATWTSALATHPTVSRVISTLANGTTYDVRLAARDASGNQSAYGAVATGQPIDTTAPSTPTGLSLAASDGTIAAQWSDSTESDLAAYDVRWRVSGTTTWTGSTQVTISQASITGLVNGTTYDVQVAARDNAGNASAFSAAASAKPMAATDTTAPAIPTGLALAPGDGSLTATWAANTEPDLAQYRVRWRATSTTTWSYRSVTSATTTTVSSLTWGVAYEFQLAARDVAGNQSGWSTVASASPQDLTAPSALTGLTLSPGDSSIRVDWNVSVDADVVSYLVRFRMSGDVWSAPLAGSAPTRTLAGLSNGTNYDVQVAALDGAGNQSAWSAVVNGTPVDVQAPAAPTGLVATPGDSTVTLNWTESGASDLATYRIRWRATGDALWTALDEPMNTATVDGLTNGRTYEFQVAAVDVVSNASAWSASATARPLDTLPPGAPVGVRVAASADSLSVSWDAPVERDVASWVVTWRDASAATWQSTTTTMRARLLTPATPGATYDVRVAALDTSGNLGSASAAVRVTVAGAVDFTPPAPPSALQLSVSGDYYRASWTASSDTDVVAYDVSWRADAWSAWTTTSTTATSIDFAPLAAGSYDVTVAARDGAGNISSNNPMGTTPVGATSTGTGGGTTGAGGGGTAPGTRAAPPQVTAGSHAATVTWAVGGGSPGTLYVVRYRPVGSTRWTTVRTTSTTLTLRLTDVRYVEVQRAVVDAAHPSAPFSASTVARSRSAMPALTGVRVTGTARVAHSLRATFRSTFSKNVRYRYQWYANGRAIRGATHRAYMPGRAQASRRISVAVSVLHPQGFVVQRVAARAVRITR